MPNVLAPCLKTESVASIGSIMWGIVVAVTFLNYILHLLPRRQADYPTYLHPQRINHDGVHPKIRGLWAIFWGTLEVQAESNDSASEQTDSLGSLGWDPWDSVWIDLASYQVAAECPEPPPPQSNDQVLPNADDLGGSP